MLARYSSHCMSVRLSVHPSQDSSMRIAKHRITKTTLHNSPWTSFFDAKDVLKFWCDHPKVGAKCRWLGENCVYNWSRIFRLGCHTAENICPFATVVCVHDGALAEQYVVSSTMLVVVEVCWKHVHPVYINNFTCRGSLFITRMDHFSITCMWHRASHARFAIVEPVATMHVQNYAGSQIKSGCCWTYSSGCLCYSYSSSTTFQL